ncbi:MAG: thermonuclease family protein [Thermoplasmata archaeon]|nr:thermonuclease family protein [Thermoplasmata archaeon]
MKTVQKIIIGDSRRMEEVKDESVYLIVTSPPYWQLKDYGMEDQIGFNDSYEDYINNLNIVWKECIRTLHPGCRMTINIGDQFARSVYYGRYKVIPIRTEIIRFAETMGMDFMGSIIWQKKTTMNTTGGATVMGSFPCPRNGIVEIDYEYILLFRKLGKTPKIQSELKRLSRMSKEEWKTFFSGHWYFNGVRQNKHIAMFPEELPRRLIRMFTFPGETVLDPFLGSGTTTLAARRLGRNSIGYEMNKDYLSIIKEKVGISQKGLFEKTDFKIIYQQARETNWKDELKKLPYIFHDPIKFDKKIDPRKLGFGSKITGNEKNGVEGRFHRIKKIESPEIVVLGNGVKVRLIGIRENLEKRKRAIEFLKLKTKGQQIYMKFDREKFDSQGNLRAYLYLKNKTFLNAHLIKKGLAEIDEQDNFMKKSIFFSYRNNR